MNIPSASCSLKHILKKIMKQGDNLYFNYTAEGIPLIELAIKDFIWKFPFSPILRRKLQVKTCHYQNIWVLQKFQDIFNIMTT